MQIKNQLFYIIILLVSIPALKAQEIDTIKFFSEIFEEERKVYIHTPEFYKYSSDSMKFPVIFLLDGQHEWFVNPVLSDIKYLQYTHEIPQAIVVVIPHTDRKKECAIKDLETELPLHKFIRSELIQHINNYKISDYKVIMGHSFSASFSLYSYYLRPDFYSAVIAHTPLDEMELLIRGYNMKDGISKDEIFISVGSIQSGKDDYHRKAYESLKSKYKEFFREINTYEANYSAHNAVPVTATPTFLSRIFENFRGRYSEIAGVNLNYELKKQPFSKEKECNRVLSASKIGNTFYPPEVAEINGIASRFLFSEYNDHAQEIYKLGLDYYPHYYEFYLSLYNLLLDEDKDNAKKHLIKAESLILALEKGDNADLLKEIREEKMKNGW